MSNALGRGMESIPDDRTMTVKQIAEALGRPERTVHDWAKLASAKIAEISAKIAEAKATSKPARYTLEEACQIIEEGMGKAAADIYRTNAVNAALNIQPNRKTKLPSGAQMNAMVKVYGPQECAKRFDFLMGYSTNRTKIQALPKQEELATPEQAELAFGEMRRRFNLEGPAS